MTITAKREKTVDCSGPYAIVQLAILGSAGSGITSVDGLNQAGKTVAVKTGSTGDVSVTKNPPNATIAHLADEAARMTADVQGKGGGLLYDRLTIYRDQAANPDAATTVYVAFQDPDCWGTAVGVDHPEPFGGLGLLRGHAVGIDACLMGR